MKLFSFKKKAKKLICDWCGKEMEKVCCTKSASNKIFEFCSESCKSNFRKSRKGWL
ncbi:MAG: TRASH domain-containing protein [archaeon]